MNNSDEEQFIDYINSVIDHNSQENIEKMGLVLVAFGQLTHYIDEFEKVEKDKLTACMKAVDNAGLSLTLKTEIIQKMHDFLVRDFPEIYTKHKADIVSVIQLKYLQ